MNKTETSHITHCYVHFGVIIGSHDVTRWEARRLNDSDDRLVQFCGKFWGVNMEEEVNMWRESVQDDCSDKNEEDVGEQRR